MIRRSREADYFADQRAAARVALERHHVEFHTDVAYGGRGRVAPTVDLSLSGVAFLVDEELAVGTELRLRIQIPFKRRYLRATGKVVRVVPAGEHVVVMASYRPLLEDADEALFTSLMELLTG